MSHLGHLRLLESESIHIMREVASEFQRPVMLYSIGKDSSVLLRLAQKAFHPAPIPFPLLHIDTTYKFREMIEFRDRYTAEIGAKLIVYTNREAIDDGANPYRLGTQRCCGLLKTKALLDGLRQGNFDAAIGGARRDEEKSRAKERIFSFRDEKGQWDPKNQRPELWNLFNARIHPGESLRDFPAVQLDRNGHLAVHSRREHSDRADVFRQGARSAGARRLADHAGAAVHSGTAGREAADGSLPHAIARLQPLHRRHPVRRRHDSEDHRRAGVIPQIGTRESRDRSRPGRLHGDQETGRIFLMAAVAKTPVAFQIEDFLAQEQAKDLLRFTTAGSVDDGKSTLIGRLLYDSQSVYEDQLKAVTKASVNRSAGTIDFSLLTDGLRAEREQGITIDVAYRYFATARRKFIIADTPGHEQYTRNMATGASTADLAVILIDARNGVLQQSRRHGYIASLLGIPNFVVAVNKMDAVGYDEAVFRAIETEYREFIGRLSVQLNAPHPYFLPISALEGDNVVRPSRNMPWFQGPSLLEFLRNRSGAPAHPS